MKLTAALICLTFVLVSSARGQISDEELANRALRRINLLLSLASEGKPPLEDGMLTNTIVRLQWVSRSELVNRKHYWERWLADRSTPWGVTGSETLEDFVFYDNSVCAYQQTVSDKLQGGSALSVGSIWRRWIRPDQGFALFKRITEEFPDSCQITNEPGELSWCVLMTYIDKGEIRFRHFYVPSRLEIQTLLSKVQFLTKEDDSKFSTHDDRYDTPEWMIRELKYDKNALWGK